MNCDSAAASSETWPGLSKSQINVYGLPRDSNC